jgi:DNA-binding MarR family transcriptional regulator
VRVNVIEPKVVRTLPSVAPNPLFLRDEELTRGIELLDAAYRSLIGEPDRTLAEEGLGRNHRWVLYFVGRHPGITMVELVGRVHLSKQSLSRLVNELVAKALLARRRGTRDRRERLLDLTARGRQLEEVLNGRLRRRLARAYRGAGAEAVAGYHRVLLGLIDDGRQAAGPTA